MHAPKHLADSDSPAAKRTVNQADRGYNLTIKRIRKREFQDEMEWVAPWSDLVAWVSVHAPKKSRRQRPVSTETMLRTHFIHHWFGLSYPAVEGALHDTWMYRGFAGLDGFCRRQPDEVEILRFCYLLEDHKLNNRLLQVINNVLGGRDLMRGTGTVVNVTLITAPSSTENASGERGPDMHRSRKGNQRHFGVKAHIGVDAESGVAHTVLGTSGNVNDLTRAKTLLNGLGAHAFCDAGYQGASKRTDAKQEVQWHAAMLRGKGKSLGQRSPLAAMIVRVGKITASIRVEVEHPFRGSSGSSGSAKSATAGWR